MFEALKDRFETIFNGIRGKGRLSEEDVTAALREVRRALLEADVNYKVVKELTEAIKARATGQDIMASITPAQQVLTIVFEELASVMGGDVSPLAVSSKPPTVYLMAGLQGSGKTTTAVKIAKKISRSHKPMVVACDLRRPAAILQLKTLAKSAGVLFYGPAEGDTDPVKVAKDSLAYGADHLADVILIDTAGRIQIDDDLMDELLAIKNAVPPHEVLLVVDAMAGQESVAVAEAFNKKIGITGVVLTKLDGDARGGAALAIGTVTGAPVKLAGVGEKIDDIEIFDAKRMAQRILGMGDVMGLMEKLEQVTAGVDTDRITENIKKNKFTLEDMLFQFQQVRKMGPLNKVLEMLPAFGKMSDSDMQSSDKLMVYMEAIILSMTPKERRNPEIIKGSRRKRIAMGSGTSVQQVNQLLHKYEQMKQMLKSAGKGLPFKKGGKLSGAMSKIFGRM